MVHRLFVGMVARRWGKRKTSDRSVVGGWMDSGSKRTMGWAVHGNLSGNGWQEEIDGNPRDRGGFISSIDNGGGAYEFRGLGDVFPSGNTSAFCPRCLHPSPVARFVPKVILAMLAIMCMHGEFRPSLLHMNGGAHLSSHVCLQRETPICPMDPLPLRLLGEIIQNNSKQLGKLKTSCWKTKAAKEANLVFLNWQSVPSDRL